MKNKKIIIGILIVGIILVGGSWVWFSRIYPQTQETTSETTTPIISETTNLKEACINATIRGIELDIERCQEWLKLPEEELTEGAEPREKIESRLNQLKAELEKYKNIQLQDYKLPEKREVIGWVNQPCKENTILQIEGMTRSGPFYHVVGVKGDNYGIIKPQIKYQITIYLVYPRYYPFSNYYIYINNWEQMQ